MDLELVFIQHKWEQVSSGALHKSSTSGVLHKSETGKVRPPAPALVLHHNTGYSPGRAGKISLSLIQKKTDTTGFVGGNTWEFPPTKEPDHTTLLEVNQTCHQTQSFQMAFKYHIHKCKNSKGSLDRKIC